ncbi:hypothetical protein ACFQDZ_16715 [Sulfitobacter pacificus]|uniref:hypothetical protein n=1 Tax=Sulfitobacter pacificus TaxID=1499314 RepID=UPI003605E2C3
MPKVIPVSILALGLFTVTFAVNLQAPLYEAYAAESNVGATAVTVAFAAYVGGSCQRSCCSVAYQTGLGGGYRLHWR